MSSTTSTTQPTEDFVPPPSSAPRPFGRRALAALGFGNIGALIQALITMLTSDSSITGVQLLAKPFATIAQFAVGGVTLPVLYLLIAAVAVWFVVERTGTGRRLYAAGFNPNAARLQGVRVDRLRFLALLSSAVLSGIAGVVFTAQVGSGSPIADISVADARRLLEVNVIGTLLGVRAAARAMADGGGSVITFSSVNGVIDTTGLGAYAATKFAVRGLTRVAALELAPLGIRVNSVCPGSIDTALTDTPDFAATDWSAYTSTIPLAHRGHPAEVAQAVRYLAADEGAYVTGTDLVIDGGIAAGRRLP